MHLVVLSSLFSVILLEDNPFMAGAFHGVGEADVVINVGVSGPGVVQRAIEKVPGASFDVLAETVKKTAFKNHSCRPIGRSNG